jgi:hypothetical protein
VGGNILQISLPWVFHGRAYERRHRRQGSGGGSIPLER